MKCTAHLQVAKEYKKAIACSQFLEKIIKSTNEYNREYLGDGIHDFQKDRAVITIEFEVPDSIFEPEPEPIKVKGEMKP